MTTTAQEESVSGEEEPGGDSVLLSSFEVNRMKSIAQAIKQGAEEQRARHEQQISRLEAEVSMLRSERATMRGSDPAAHKRGTLQRQSFQHYNVSELTKDLQRISRQLADEASQLMLAMNESNVASGLAAVQDSSQGASQDDALRSQIGELEMQRHQMQEEVQSLQEDCADLAGEVNRLEDLNFLAETALLKYAGELEDTRSALKAATTRVQDLEKMQDREGSPASPFDDVPTTYSEPGSSPGKKAAKAVSTLELVRNLRTVQVCK